MSSLIICTAHQISLWWSNKKRY